MALAYLYSEERTKIERYQYELNTNAQEASELGKKPGDKITIVFKNEKFQAVGFPSCFDRDWKRIHWKIIETIAERISDIELAYQNLLG